MTGAERGFDAWRAELLHTGRFIADDDNSVDPDEAERRFLRYVEMLEALRGDEPASYALALFESIQVEEDHAVYGMTDAVAWKFGAETYYRSLLRELPRLIEAVPGQAGELLNRTTNDAAVDECAPVFNRLLWEMSAQAREPILAFIAEQERDGWLRDAVGVLGARPHLATG